MRVVVSEFMSLDGVVQAPGGPEEDTDGGFAHGGWSMPFFDPAVMGAAIGAGVVPVEALLFGRRTFEVMAGAWPERAGDPFADQMNVVEKYVVTGTLSTGRRHLAQLPRDPAADGAHGRDRRGQGQGRRRPVGHVWQRHAGPAALLAAGLVDELMLMIEPVLLGGGKRIFTDDGVGRTPSSSWTRRSPPAPA